MFEKHKIVFTFGTLYESTIISALLGYEPKSFLANLKNYAVFQGTSEALSEKIKADIKQRRDIKNFVFLFAKKVDPTVRSYINGKAYYVTTDDEKILDLWERFPDWYHKERAEIEDEYGKKFQALVYVQNIDGKQLQHFERVPYDLNSIIENAKKQRQKFQNELHRS